MSSQDTYRLVSLTVLLLVLVSEKLFREPLYKESLTLIPKL